MWNTQDQSGGQDAVDIKRYMRTSRLYSLFGVILILVGVLVALGAPMGIFIIIGVLMAVVGVGMMIIGVLRGAAASNR